MGSSVWALSIAIVVYVAMLLCGAAEISCCFVECSSLDNLFLCHLHSVVDLLPLSNRGTGAACFQIVVAQSQFRIQLLTRVWAPNGYVKLTEKFI